MKEKHQAYCGSTPIKEKLGKEGVLTSVMLEGSLPHGVANSQKGIRKPGLRGGMIPIEYYLGKTLCLSFNEKKRLLQKGAGPNFGEQK